jgi:hypothetical protein
VRGHSGSVGGRGSRRAPECSTVLRLSRSFALPLWPTIRAPVHRRLPPLPHGRGSWLTVWCVVRHCQAAHVEPGVPIPLTPIPSPLPGARGAMRDSHCSLKTQSPPLAPVKRGRGVGGEGAIWFRGRARLPPSPRVLNRTAAQQELRPPVMVHKPGTSSTQAACVAPAPSRSRLVVDRLVRGVWCGIARSPTWNQGYFHPSPPSPLPFQGRGVPGAIPTAA